MTRSPKTHLLVPALLSGALLAGQSAAARDDVQLKFAQQDDQAAPAVESVPNETPDENAVREKLRQLRRENRQNGDGEQVPPQRDPGARRPDGASERGRRLDQVPDQTEVAPQKPEAPAVTAPPPAAEPPAPPVAATPPPPAPPSVAPATADPEPAPQPKPAATPAATPSAPPPAAPPTEPVLEPVPAKPTAPPTAAPPPPAPPQPTAQQPVPPPAPPAPAAAPQPQTPVTAPVPPPVQPRPLNSRDGGGNRPQPGSSSQPRSLNDVINARVKSQQGGTTVIQEPDRRVIVKDNNRAIIQSDETARIRQVAPTARVEQAAPGITRTIVDRPGNEKIITETGPQGQILRRYRQDASGQITIIIDNTRRKKDRFGRDLAIGLGVGAGIIAGAAILNSIVNVPKPVVRVPRDKYIVRSEDASNEDVYEALSAPPVDRIERRYTLDEVRATARLRDRMRRIDLDDVNFEFGSWNADRSEYPKLAYIAQAMQRVIARNPNEVFLIEGYTDAVGSDDDNLTLSDRRAESVATVLSRHFNVPFENLATQGYGEQFLKVVTQRPERSNRRVAVRRITPLIAGNDTQRRRPYDDQRRDDDRRHDGQRYEERGYEDRRYDKRRYDERYERRDRRY